MNNRLLGFDDWRVGGQSGVFLQVTRAFGDGDVFDFIKSKYCSYSPEIHVTDVPKYDEVYLVTVSDGMVFSQLEAILQKVEKGFSGSVNKAHFLVEFFCTETSPNDPFRDNLSLTIAEINTNTKDLVIGVLDGHVIPEQLNFDKFNPEILSWRLADELPRAISEEIALQYGEPFGKKISTIEEG